MWVLLRCPRCHVRGNFNGRGRCSCRRAYLLHSFAGRTVTVPDHTFRWIPDVDGDNVALYDDGYEEPGKWVPLEAGTYTIRDGRERHFARKPADPQWNWRPTRYAQNEDDP